ncbi:dinitrogenase iron-molybdenum cofactor biosynthesis protein [Methanosarcina sp. KYL-1]|uniref:NifB/NifX family molybdenum-iron cluster-binding protein n=1 Tax=Methanosarcina sp. KYL-1 TaxID=2602068 RepID=UPI002100FA6B|nr:NifB/NifX family molybdenum-iron cluster-binding protein [Methanosarcina sp. KYL-1]MCQ1534166.1 dinitrogenase iron-molybdenum cofactor biosynthesis protein [Methanosarcina sp. KYL-1]
MKVCISSTGKDLESEVDPQFGRCGYFVIVDLDTGSVTSLKNPGPEASGGSGIRAAEAIVNSKADILLTGSVGPNSFSILSEVGVEVRVGVKGTVADALKQYEAGDLCIIDSPNSSAHNGMKNS